MKILTFWLKLRSLKESETIDQNLSILFHFKIENRLRIDKHKPFQRSG